MTARPHLVKGRGLLAAALAVSLAACSGLAAPAPGATVGASSPTEAPSRTPITSPSIAIAFSAKIRTPEPIAGATPTPTPGPGLWRIQGYVVDAEGTPLADVCVAVGPNGCQKFSPHTDDRGHWFLDVAAGRANFDFFLSLPGYDTVWLHLQPTGPAEYNVVLVRAA